MLQPKNLLDILDLLVLHNLVVLRVSHIEQFTTKREHAVVVTTDDAETCDGERLGGITFGQDECAVCGLLCACVVGVGELG